MIYDYRQHIMPLVLQTTHHAPCSNQLSVTRFHYRVPITVYCLWT